jgi:hypothetical protein
MKRNLFIASLGTFVFACLPSLARAEGSEQRAWSAADVETPGWPEPSWCCGSAVVWLDIPHGVYYRKGESRYGRTERGAYTCEDHANKTGNRAG